MKPTTFFLFFVILSSYSPYSIASKIQSIHSIQQAVEQYISANLSKKTDYKTRHSQLDKRLTLPLCDQTLEIFNHLGSLKPGRNSIGVKCNGAKRWTVYTSVNISIYKEVIILLQSLRRGDILNKSLLQFEKKEISSLRSGYLSNPTPIIGKQARRNLSAGIVLQKSHFVEPKIIRRGETVTITSSSPNLSISMMGIAMMDGVKGQNIRVKNSKSQQIVQATVARPGHVIVLF